MGGLGPSLFAVAQSWFLGALALSFLVFALALFGFLGLFGLLWFAGIGLFQFWFTVWAAGGFARIFPLLFILHTCAESDEFFSVPVAVF